MLSQEITPPQKNTPLKQFCPHCCQQKHRKKRKELSAPNFSLMDIWPENEEMDFFTASNGV